MEELKAKRQVKKGAITRIYNFCCDNNADIDEIKVRVLKLDSLYEQYEKIQDEIDELTTTEAEKVVEEQYRNEIETKCFATKAIYSSRQREHGLDNTVIETKTTSEVTQAMQSIAESQTTMGVILQKLSFDVEERSTSNSAATRVAQSLETSTSPEVSQAIQSIAQSQMAMGVILEKLSEDRTGSFTSNIRDGSTVSQQQEPKLPRIQIPEFDGTYTEWIRFHDLFEALIHSRNSISNVEKLENLHTKLKGEPLSLIKHLKPTNENYTIAWEILNDKYDKSENIRKAYLELVFDQPVMKSSTVLDIKRLYNNTNEGVNALIVLEDHVKYWDTVLIFHLERKLDSETHILWCREKRDVKNPTFKSFMKFLQNRMSELESIQQITTKQQSKSVVFHHPRNQTAAYSSTLQACVVCNDNHSLYQCEEFKKLSIEERRDMVRQSGLCFNCLRPNHLVKHCNGSTCRKCNAKHNTLLHPLETHQNMVPYNPDNQQMPTSLAINTFNKKSDSITMLPTAIITVRDQNGNLQQCRALLDSGAQATLISEPCAQRLFLKRVYDNTLMFGVGTNQGGYSKGKVNLEIVSNVFGKSIRTEAFCLPKLTQNLPAYDISSEKFDFFKHINIADPEFQKSSKIDIIIGADIFISLRIA